jgi:hypothetical protein
VSEQTTDSAGEPDLEVTGDHAAAAAEDLGDAGDLGVAAERDRLARLLRETRLQLTMTQARLAALEQSATLELGRTLVRAARRPWPRGAQLPRDLYRMWRGGVSQASPASGATSPAMLALASAQLSDLAGGGERLLSALTAPGLSSRSELPGVAPGLVLTGVLTARACAAIAPDAAVHPLLPHDADILLESCGADLVIIQAAALLAGSAWAYAVDPAGADRGRRLARLIAAARALGKPVIFVRDIPAHLAPGLDWVAASCDAITDDDFGVPLAQFNPIALPLVRDRRPVYAGVREPRESPALRALLDGLTGPDGPVRVSGEIPWRQRAALYQEHSLFVAARAEQAREQWCSGARVLLASGDRADLLRALAEASAAGPPGWPEVVAALRSVFPDQATAGRLTGLTRLAGLPDGLIAGRRIAVLAFAGGTGAAQTLGAGVLNQQLRPAELVVCAGRDETTVRTVTGVLAEVAARGVPVHVISHPDQDWIRACASAASAPWAAPWPADHEYADSYLLDLACARECSQADAIGYAGAEYAYITALESPRLARRELLGPDRLDACHGLRLFSASHTPVVMS